MDTDNAAEARARIAQIVFGSFAAQALSCAVKLGIADVIGDRELGCEEVSEACSAHAPSMRRLMRGLVVLGLVAEQSPGRFTMTPAGALLRSDRPDTVRSAVQVFTDPALLRASQDLDFSVRTGGPAFDEVFGMNLFAYLKEHPELSTRFNSAMGKGISTTAAALLAAYPFGDAGTVVDVGGGDGTLLAAIMSEHRDMRGILFDTPEGLAQSAGVLEKAGVAERCAVEPGDMFLAVPEGGDLYLLKSVLNDWNDDDALTVLRHCREALRDDGRVLLVEPVMPEGNELPSPAMALSDLGMLANVGGRTRSRSEFEEMLAKTGFTLTSATALPEPEVFWVLEAAPV